MMRAWVSLLLACGFLGLFAACQATTSDSPVEQQITYIDPALLTISDGQMSVIVMAEDSRVAADAIRTVGGNLRRDLSIIGAVSADVTPAQLLQLRTTGGLYSIIENKTVEAAGSILPTDDPTAYILSDPAVQNVGAELVHATGVRGAGVTIAVLDSGFELAPEMTDLLGNSAEQRFLGQADFVNEGQCDTVSTNHVQEDGYCFSNLRGSTDPYGHGSHVAGTIWNSLRDETTGTTMGIAPDANLLSVRALNEDGIGTYEDVIEALQFIINNQALYGIDVLNLSISGHARTPYFVDPLIRAVETAWANGIVVIVSAGNRGRQAQSITVPGNDPYVITVGGLDTNDTPVNFADDTVAIWSSNGPTLDGFTKPDVLAPGSNLISFVYSQTVPISVTSVISGETVTQTVYRNKTTLSRLYPDYSETRDFFRMNGTSMSAAVTSGVAALVLQANPSLTPDQVKFRLMYTARLALDEESGEPSFNLFQQGNGRVWAPDAVSGSGVPLESANVGLDIQAELAHPWIPLAPPDPINGPDSDGDGVVDGLDVCPGSPEWLSVNSVGCYGSEDYAPTDMDGDGIPDRLDLDSDHDGTFDLVETNLSAAQINALDADGDGRIDLSQAVGENGLVDGLEVSADSGQPNFTLADIDGDGVFDFRSQQYHYQGAVQKTLTDDKRYELFIIPETVDRSAQLLGVFDKADQAWVEFALLDTLGLTFDNGLPIIGGDLVWNGGTFYWGGGTFYWGGGTFYWGGGTFYWGGGTFYWGGGTFYWGGGAFYWGGTTLYPSVDVTGIADEALIWPEED